MVDLSNPTHREQDYRIRYYFISDYMVIIPVYS